MIEPNIPTVMTTIARGFRFVMTAMMIAALPWYMRFRANREIYDFLPNPCNLSLADGSISFSDTTGDMDGNMLPHCGVIDDLSGVHDWFRTAEIPAAENMFDDFYFDFDPDEELWYEQHGMFCTCAARGMMLCKRVPPDIPVAMAIFATRVQIPDSII